MGNVTLHFSPRKSLREFTESHSKISLLKKVKNTKDTNNMIIHGENLASLAALKAGAGLSDNKVEVDIIYIDPPYNVGGSQGYKNKWKGKSEKERDWAGDHGQFLDFMEPRLKIGRSLLSEEGVMFVSICDGEYCRLKILMDQIFGESNCLGTAIWNQGRGSSGKHLATVHEYVLIYAKNSMLCPPLRERKQSAIPILEKAEELKKAGVSYEDAQKEFNKWLKFAKEEGIVGKNESSYRLHPESFHPFQTTASCAQDKPETRCHKKLKHPGTGKFAKVPSKGWKWSESTLDKMYDPKNAVHGNGFTIAGKLCFGKDESVVPRKVQYLVDKQDQIRSTMIDVSHSLGKSDLPKGITFTTPKPISLIKNLIASYPKKDALVLDYFAGSAATACAVDDLNHEDDGTRNWIMIEEMGSTFNLVLKPRLKQAIQNENFTEYELRNVTVEDEDLMKVFSEYSKEYISAYHLLEEECSKENQGMNVVGFDPRGKQVVAIVNPENRKGKYFFEKELKLLKEKINECKAVKTLIYTINDGSVGDEEPWRGVDKHILAGTKCKNLKVVEIPEQLIKEWTEVLTAMAA